MSDPPSTIPDPIQASGGVVAWGRLWLLGGTLAVQRRMLVITRVIE
jgi:hypothetical protein